MSLCLGWKILILIMMVKLYHDTRKLRRELRSVAHKTRSMMKKED